MSSEEREGEVERQVQQRAFKYVVIVAVMEFFNYSQTRL
jgi:hypothetical protein